MRVASVYRYLFIIMHDRTYYFISVHTYIHIRVCAFEVTLLVYRLPNCYITANTYIIRVYTC